MNLECTMAAHLAATSGFQVASGPTVVGALRLVLAVPSPLLRLVWPGATSESARPPAGGAPARRGHPDRPVPRRAPGPAAGDSPGPGGLGPGLSEAPTRSPGSVRPGPGGVRTFEEPSRAPCPSPKFVVVGCGPARMTARENRPLPSLSTVQPEGRCVNRDLKVKDAEAAADSAEADDSRSRSACGWGAACLQVDSSSARAACVQVT